MAGGWGVGGVCRAGTPVLSAWLAPIFTVKPSKYLQPLWQLIAFDPVCRCESPAYSCFLKNSLFSHTSLIIQLLIVSKRKSENANSGPLSLGWCIFLPPCRGWSGGSSPLSFSRPRPPGCACDHFREGLWPAGCRYAPPLAVESGSDQESLGVIELLG